MAGINDWLIAATVLIFGLIPCGIRVSRGKPAERLVALEMAGTLTALDLMTLARGFGQPSFIDLALALAFVSLPGFLLFVHYLERWP